jgi:hypothetical protein
MTTLEERAPGYFMTPTERDALSDLLAKAERISADLADAYRAAQRIVTGTTDLTDAPQYHPERMGYLHEVRVGDRVLFAGGWREVATRYQHTNGVLVVRFTDPDMDALLDKGTHAIRIQKLADEQQADAIHRRDNGGL